MFKFTKKFDTKHLTRSLAKPLCVPGMYIGTKVPIPLEGASPLQASW